MDTANDTVKVTVPSDDPIVAYHERAATCALTLTRSRMLAGLKSAAAFVCQDPTRFHLCGVKIERAPSGGSLAFLRFVATDGHTLARADVPTTEITNAPAWRDLIVDGESVAAAIKALRHTKKEAEHPVTLTIIDRGKGRVPVARLTIAKYPEGSSTTLDLKLIDADFPPYEQVIPARREQTSERVNNYSDQRKSKRDAASLIGLQPFYVARAASAVQDFYGGKYPEARGMELSLPHSELDPVRVDFHTPECGEFTAVIMPMRI